jgi:hypothetical protein
MTQVERNFGTKALRRDGVRCDTKGGRALWRLSVDKPGLAKLLIYYFVTAVSIRKANLLKRIAAHKQDYTVV